MLYGTGAVYYRHELANASPMGFLACLVVACCRYLLPIAMMARPCRRQTHARSHKHDRSRTIPHTCNHPHRRQNVPIAQPPHHAPWCASPRRHAGRINSEITRKACGLASSRKVGVAKSFIASWILAAFRRSGIIFCRRVWEGNEERIRYYGGRRVSCGTNRIQWISPRDPSGL